MSCERTTRVRSIRAVKFEQISVPWDIVLSEMPYSTTSWNGMNPENASSDALRHTLLFLFLRLLCKTSVDLYTWPVLLNKLSKGLLPILPCSSRTVANGGRNLPARSKSRINPHQISSCFLEFDAEFFSVAVAQAALLVSAAHFIKSVSWSFVWLLESNGRWEEEPVSQYLPYLTRVCLGTVIRSRIHYLAEHELRGHFVEMLPSKHQDNWRDRLECVRCSGFSSNSDELFQKKGCD